MRLRLAPADLIDMPEDVEPALRAAGQEARWEALTAGRRRGLLHQVSTAKTSATRAKRVAALVAGLS